MIKINEKYKCSGCHACSAICPKDCITMQVDEEGFKYPKVDAELCINCGLCEKVCPILHHTFKNDAPIAYAAVNFNDQVRELSSSGGVFYLIAKYVIENGGVVFGAKFDDDFNVVHSYAQTMEEIESFMGSKYAQSIIGENYTYAKKFLDSGKLVLFTGTPCQIGGLKAFLNKGYENLICQDLICHGVPSPKVWQRYMRFQEKNKKSKICGVSFRNKTYGWKTFSMMLDFLNGDKVVERFATDLYMTSFLRDLCLRPSCYKCSFKGKSRDADITLADFWGVQNVMPEMDDDKGTSLVIVHSPKGQQIFETIKENLRFQTVDFELATKNNPMMMQSASDKKERKRFLIDIEKKPFDKVVNKYCTLKVKLIIRVKGKIKRVLKVT